MRKFYISLVCGSLICSKNSRHYILHRNRYEMFYARQYDGMFFIYDNNILLHYQIKNAS